MADLPASGMYSAEQTAARLGISRRYLDMLIADDKCPVPFVMIGSRRKWRAAQVERFVDPEAAVDVAW